IAVLRAAIAGAEAQLDLIRNQLGAEASAAALNRERAALQLSDAQENGASEAQLRVLQIDVELAQLAVEQLDSTPNADLQAEILSLKQQVDTLLLQKESMRLIAPTDGDILGLNLSLGGRVRDGGVIATLTNLDQRVVWANANNNNLSQMEEGMSILLMLPDAPDQLFSGEIATLPFPHGSGGTRSEEVEITLAERLYEQVAFGARVDVIVTVTENENTLWLPPVALRDFAGQTFVIVQEGDDEQRIDVEIGLQSATRVEIVEGLEEGQLVIAP
ncbi:MAG: efflux RND transporter periplasmic adaptor subunit, partial [Candidatus Promineifilaceae bacterium]